MAFLFVPRAQMQGGKWVSSLLCGVGSTERCAELSRVAAPYSHLQIFSATTAGVACEYGNAKQCVSAGERWEGLEQLDHAAISFDRGCGMNNADACMGYYVFLTRQPDYLTFARQTMERTCASGGGDRSSCAFMTIVYEQEGKNREALAIVRSFCDRTGSGPECSTAAELSRTFGDFPAAEKYDAMACVAGESGSCSNSRPSPMLSQSAETRVAAHAERAQGKRLDPAMEALARSAVQEFRNFARDFSKKVNSRDKLANQRRMASLQSYQRKWKHYYERSQKLRLSKSNQNNTQKALVDSLRQMENLTLSAIKSLRSKASDHPRRLKVAADRASSRKLQIERMLKAAEAFDARRTASARSAALYSPGK